LRSRSEAPLHNTVITLHGPEIEPKEVAFLGYAVSGKGVSPTQEERSCMQMAFPKKLQKHAKSFPTPCSHYRHFIHGFADIVTPFYKLFQRLVVVPMDQRVTFCELSHSDNSSYFGFPHNRQLVYFGHRRKQQIQPEEEEVIAFQIKLLSKRERNNCTTYKELLAVIQAVKIHHHYLFGGQFLIRNDHQAMKRLRKFRNLDDQLAGWLELLRAQDFNSSQSEDYKFVAWGSREDC